uniref:Uncharacterized protein n=1 Tax=Plectus sambesii TaxID=2011161 RepID=A0A914VZR4_9BILA
MTFMPLEQPVLITVNNKPSKGTFGRFNPPPFHQHSNKSGGILDSWQKVEDHTGVTYYWNTNGNAYSSPPPSSVQQNRSPLTAHRLSGGGLFSLQPPATNNSRRPSKERNGFVPHLPSSSAPAMKDRSNGYTNGVSVAKERHSNYAVGSIFTNGNAKERGGGYMNGNMNGNGAGGPIVTIVSNNGAATVARNGNGYAKTLQSKQVQSKQHHYHHQNGGVVTPRTADPSQLIWSVSNSANGKRLKGEGMTRDARIARDSTVVFWSLNT